MGDSLGMRRLAPTLGQNLELKVMTWFRDRADELDAARRAVRLPPVARR